MILTISEKVATIQGVVTFDDIQTLFENNITSAYNRFNRNGFSIIGIYTKTYGFHGKYTAHTGDDAARAIYSRHLAKHVKAREVYNIIYPLDESINAYIALLIANFYQ